jgi:hypothetical protein
MPLFDAAAFMPAPISPFRVMMIFCFCRCAAADITRRMIAFHFDCLSFSFADYADISRYAIRRRRCRLRFIFFRRHYAITPFLFSRAAIR